MENAPKETAELVKHLEALAEDFESDHTAELLTYVTHAEAEVRAAAARGLWEGDMALALEPLMTLAEKDSDEEVRATAISVLGRLIYEGLLYDPEMENEDLSSPEAIEKARTFLTSMLHEAGQPLLLRRRSLEALAFDPSEKEVAVIKRWLKDKNADLRMSAVFAMGRAGLDEFEKPILKALEDSNDEVRREAIRAVGEAGLESGIKKLERFIGGDNRELKLEAILALGMVGGERAEEILMDLSEGEDEEVAEFAAEALDQLVNMAEEEEWDEEEGEGDEEEEDD